MLNLAQLTVGFIGGGNMAGALIGGLLERGAVAQHLRVADPLESARATLAARYGVTVSDAPDGALGRCDVVVMAVKPKQVRSASAALAAHLGAGVVVSIAAGIRTVDLARWLPAGCPIVRAMPNTPALIGAGVSGLYAPPGVSSAQRAVAEVLLGAVGSVIWFDTESLLDVVTAVSGSGPAYFFYFMEALEQSAVRHGIDPAAARQLAQSTCAGAAALAMQTQDPLEVLRERVTSKGGTTFAALERLRADRVAAAIDAAVTAAVVRSRELGEESGRD
jgi:pyrroline-5-carboxylate reductase